MDAIKYIAFLGFSSMHAPLNACLDKDGITWRPSARRNLDTTLFVKNQGVILHFIIGADALGIEPKSDGDFIFEHLTMTIIEEDKKHGKYTGHLPRGLTQSDTRDQIREKLGTPTRVTEDIDNYYLDALVWTLAFEEGEFQFLELATPSSGKRKHGLCP